MSGADARDLGVAAEQLAAAYLEQHGYQIIVRNHRCTLGEVDLIAWDDSVLCFVEVRSRKNADYGDPLESIDGKKIARVVCAAKDFLRTLPGPWPEMRFDAVGIIVASPPEIRLIKGAFEVSDAKVRRED